jgi:glycine dehydrogenase subunit 1
MAQRVTGRPKVLIARTVHPQYREVVRTYVKNVGIELEELPYGKDGRIDAAALGRSLDDRTAAVVFQSPNFSGSSRTPRRCPRPPTAARPCPWPWSPKPCPWPCSRPLASWASTSSPGEAQSFGVPLSFGGPYLGFMACRKDFLRQMPGRISGQTTDVEGRRGVRPDPGHPRTAHPP